MSDKISLPGFGGLTRYDEEFESRFMLSPNQIVGFVIAVILFVLALKLLFPVV